MTVDSGSGESVQGLVVDATERATLAINDAIAARGGAHALECDLRDGIVARLRDAGELVLIEGRLAVPGWDAHLGGFDIAVLGRSGALAVGETKWADKNLFETMWDIFKLASATRMPRVEAAFAICGAPVKHWAKPVPCADLFEEKQVVNSAEVVRRYEKQWRDNLAGSSARTSELPAQIDIEPLARVPVEVQGREWEVRAIQVAAHGSEVWAPAPAR